ASATWVRWTFAPMLDISHDPRWGRVAESYGEDPRLVGWLGAAAVRGFQGESLSEPTSIAACAKHFVGYGLVAGGRDYEEADVGEVSLRNRALRPFRAAVEAGCATVMSAFNTIDTVPMTANVRLLREVLKEEWDFDGVVVSDWNAVAELLCHGVAGNRLRAAELALRAGVDVDMVSGCYRDTGAQALAIGAWPAAELDDAVRRVLTLKFRLGLFDAVPGDDAAVLRSHRKPPPNAGISAEKAAFGGGLREERAVPIPAEHLELAREAAAASFVLLENDGVLPLAPDKLRRVFVTGPFASATGEMFGTWTLDGRYEDVTPLGEALASRFADRVVEVDPGAFSDRTLLRARAADVIVACVGEHPDRSGEANSVTSLNLPTGQDDLLVALGRLGVPLVVVVFAGRPLVLDTAAAVANALLFAWHPGIEGGQALADVLLGVTGPRGRLPMTFPRNVGQIPTHYDRLPTGRPIPPSDDAARGRYQDSLTAPAYPFGFGLTYGDVRYGELELSSATIARGGATTASVTVTNHGSHACTETVQLYFRDPVAAISRPLRELLDFRQVELAAGASTDVEFEVRTDQFAYVDSTMRSRVDPGVFELTAGPDASRGTSATLMVTTPLS
ncbi:MAG: glycoside hydrolase family 3 N-terminal domain-containing protein, partial [Actinomycetes bacterium]